MDDQLNPSDGVALPITGLACPRPQIAGDELRSISGTDFPITGGSPPNLTCEDRLRQEISLRLHDLLIHDPTQSFSRRNALSAQHCLSDANPVRPGVLHGE